MSVIRGTVGDSVAQSVYYAEVLLCTISDNLEELGVLLLAVADAV